MNEKIKITIVKKPQNYAVVENNIKMPKTKEIGEDNTGETVSNGGSAAGKGKAFLSTSSDHLKKAKQFTSAVINTVKNYFTINSEEGVNLYNSRIQQCHTPYKGQSNETGQCPLYDNGKCASYKSVTIDGITINGCSCNIHLKANSAPMRPNDPPLCPLKRWTM
jgi:hypothetical protein